MADKNLGTIPCPVCENATHCYVRQAQSKKAAPADGASAKAGRQGAFAGALYIYCAEADGKPRCGALLARGQVAQERIRSKAKWFGEAPAAGSVPRSPPPVAKSEDSGAAAASNPGSKHTHGEPSRPPRLEPPPPAPAPSPPPPAKKQGFYGFRRKVDA